MEKKNDAELERDVQRELSWDRRTRGLGIKAKVNDGVVELEGLAPNYALYIAALNAALRVGGVMDVANEIVVRARRPYSDESLAHAVRQALERDALVPGDRIVSTVSDGWVNLKEVSTRCRKIWMRNIPSRI